MEHIMKLYESSFNDLKSGKKKREYRLNDDKRKLVRIGDTIKFLKLPNLDEEFVVDVKNVENIMMKILKIDMIILMLLYKILMMVDTILKKNQKKTVV